MNLAATARLLPESDLEYMVEKYPTFDVAQAGSEVDVVVDDYPLPPFYAPQVTSLLVILPAGYPNGNPDMFWMLPHVRLVNGNWPLSADVMQPRGDRTWQRWSRHFPGGWRPGTDGLRTYFASVRRELDKGI